MKKKYKIILIISAVAVVVVTGCTIGYLVSEQKSQENIDEDHEHDHSVEIEGSEMKNLTVQEVADPAPEDRNVESSNIENEEEIHDLISGQELRTKTVEEIAKIYEIDSNKYAKELSTYYKTNIKSTDSFELLHDNYGVEPSVAKDIAVSILTGEQINISEPSDKNEKTYSFIPVLIVLSLIYFITLFLSKRKLISILTHKRIWNIFLLITFLVSGILGVLLVIRINSGYVISLPFNILFWHVEAGIAMFVICVFHIIERRRYFRNLFSQK